MPNLFEKIFASVVNFNSPWLIKTIDNIKSDWASSIFYQSFITSLQLLIASRIVINFKKDDTGARREYRFLGYVVILMLSDLKLRLLKRKIASVENSMNDLDIEFTHAINAIDIRTVETYRKLDELDQLIQLLNEELYGPDHSKGRDGLEEEGPDDDFNEDDFLNYDDGEQDDEG